MKTASGIMSGWEYNAEPHLPQKDRWITLPESVLSSAYVCQSQGEERGRERKAVWRSTIWRIRILFELRKREAEGGRDGTRIGTNGRVAFVDLERVPVDLEVVASVGVELLAGLERKREPSKGDKKEMSVVDKVVAFPEVTRPSVREHSRQWNGGGFELCAI
jgi:hypothetical protein